MEKYIILNKIVFMLSEINEYLPCGRVKNGFDGLYIEWYI